MQKQFEYLDSFIGGTFHQDVDIDGDTLEEMILAYKRRANSEGPKLVRQDICDYLGQHPNDEELEQHFYKTFDPDLVQGYYGSVREFLTKVANLLS